MNFQEIAHKLSTVALAAPSEEAGRPTRHGDSILLPLKPFKNLQWIIIMGYERDPLDKWTARSASFA